MIALRSVRATTTGEGNGRRRGRRSVAFAATGLLLVTAGVVFVERGSHNPAAVSAPTLPSSPTAAVDSSFAAAFEAAGLLTKASAEDVALASDPSRYQWDNSSPQVSGAGNFATLRACGPDEATLAFVGNPPPCMTGWAYQTGSVHGGEVHRGLLGNVDEPALFVLDDRFFVAIEGSPGLQRESTAWLIDSESGGHAELTWRDEPTTVSSRAQALVVTDGPWSVPRMVARQQALEGFVAKLFLPQVVDGRDGTIRPLAVPDNASAELPVSHLGGGRIWIGTAPDDHLGLAYSDDGGGTWTEVALPAPLTASADELKAAASYGDLLVSIAADGDRLAITDAWSSEHDRDVHVSSDAGLSWSTVTVANAVANRYENGAHLYPLTDGRLLLVRSGDPYASQLLVSTGSDWTTLEEDLAATQATRSKYVDVNRAGTVSMYYPVELFDRGIIDGMPDAPPIRHHLSTDLEEWQTIAILGNSSMGYPTRGPQGGLQEPLFERGPRWSASSRHGDPFTSTTAALLAR